MTTQIDLATASQLFDDQVTLKFQNSQYLMGTIEERHGTTGIATNVPVSDLIEMSQGNFSPTNIPITPVDDTNVVITPYDFRVKTVIGGGQKTLFNYDMIVDQAKIHAKAGGRLVDYIKINAIFSNANVGDIYTVPVDVGPNSGMNQAKMSDALSYMESQGVDVQNYKTSMWMPALIKKSMMNDDKVVNFFYNAVKPLTNNAIKSYLDVDIRTLGENGINKIPSTVLDDVSTYLVPLISDEAMVQIFNRSLQTSITWVQQEDRWELLTVVTTGASIIQLNGVALITATNPFVANA